MGWPLWLELLGSAEVAMHRLHPSLGLGLEMIQQLAGTTGLSQIYSERKK
jgi:hypothetical protein